MSSGGKRGASSGKGKRSAQSAAETKTEDVLQAVVMTDSFQDRFRPFTIEKPRCLLPLANIPIIEYTLEFLSMNRVQEVFIYCGAHTEQVEDYIDRSRWSTASRTSPFSAIQFVRLADARSTGDVLRDLDKRSLINGDFILVHGDLVSNLLLDESLAAHRKRREGSSANIMTIVLTSGGDGEHRTKSQGITPIFAVDTKSQRCLHYDEVNPLERDSYVSLDPAISEELSASFELRSDLIDAEIDICTPEVLALWSESFDYELPRRNFLHGVLKDWELNGKMIFADILEEGYAARASNLQMYDAISRDVLGRWTFPFIPENNIMPKQNYKRHIGNLVLEDGASHANNAKLTNSIIGRNTSIGAGSTVSNSIVGRECRIGANVKLDSCFIWNDVTIEDGASIQHAILGDSVVIGKNSSIPAGSLLSFGVAVSADIRLNEEVTLSAVSLDGMPVSKDTNLLGPATNAAPFIDSELEELDDEDPSHLQRSLIYSLAHFNIVNSSTSTLSSDVDSENDSFDIGDGATTPSRSRLSSLASDDSSGKTGFHSDAVHGLVDALRAESGDFDSAKLEFMGLRLANNASDAMMRRAVATAFVRHAIELLDPDHGSLEPSKAAEKALTARPGASKFVAEVGVGGDGETEQVDFILALQSATNSSYKPSAAAVSAAPDLSRLGTLLAALLQQLYNLDILDEDAILGWWEDERAQEGEAMTAIKDKCRVLVEWLENAEEEDDESEDSDD